MANPPADGAYELRFDALYSNRRSYSFPCDGVGHVDIDSLSERGRLNYLYARAMIGVEVAWPAVRVSMPH
ncbi:hypothetical protein VAR608DRAFT_2310 [Variovorax sp. HW608]|uniref:hypothetical protein n=1 Tax=Variovorax sp. HW608 TaxID=1034889 RepID=UPI00081FF718|nr:hypothetical protein [Variovorax sp. HW608]SCK27910.1 hypothetical protein VAR608DRAFT_2310 [Variovorax sp. HW608]